MKSVKQINKRAFSPIVTKNIETSDRKKKSNSNYPTNPYRQNKDFDSFANKDKKRNSNYLKDIIKQAESTNKYRIVTQPVDDRIMNIVTSTFIPSRSRGKLDHEQSGSKIRQISQQKRTNEHFCGNCQRYLQELNSVKTQLNRVFMSKIMWKSGELSLTGLKNEYGLNADKSLKNKTTTAFKPTQSIILEAKKHFYDLMRDIESLSEIDYPKMLSLKIFKYEPHFETPKLKEEDELKSLLSQVRSHYQGKLTQWDLQDETQESDHIKAIVRNLKSRLSYYLRQNLELKAKKVIRDKAEDISFESEQYLRHIIEDVLATYTKKM